MVKTHYIVKKRLLSFQNEQLFVFNDQLSTTPKHFGLMIEMFWRRRLCEWRRRENRWQISYPWCFCRKTSFKSNLKNWFIEFEFTQMVFDSRLQLCDQWNTAYNRKRKQEHFWIILWRALELLKGNKSQKTIPVMWLYKCIQWVFKEFKVAF